MSMETYNYSDIIRNQSTLNVGTIGHVAHGKSTIVYDISSVRTQKSSNELERNITIYLGYADFYIYKKISTGEPVFSHTLLNGDADLMLCKHCSFIDCPGHKALMATMVSGTKVMKAALLVISASDDIPQPQTVGHADMLKYANIDNVLILLNKIDLLKKESEVDKRIEQLDEFITSNHALHDKPVIPVSAFKKINISEIGRFLSTIPNEDLESKANEEFSMCILRSFDVNSVGVAVDNFVGGVVGGSIEKGHIKVGDKIMISPGVLSKANGKWISRPIFTTVNSIHSEKRQLQTAFPGGLIALGLDIDPSLCKQNNMLGNTITRLSQENFDSSIENDKLATTLKLRFNYIKAYDVYKSVTRVTMVINSKPYNGTITKRETPEEKDGTIVQKVKIVLESPACVNPYDQYAILTELDGNKEIFAIGRIKNITQDVEIVLPSGIEEFRAELPETLGQVNIINDVPEITFDQELHTMENLKHNILPHILSKKKDKFSLPEPTISRNVTNFSWSNFGAFEALYESTQSATDLDNMRLYSFRTIISAYLRNQYGIADANGVSCLQDNLTIHIRTKGVKMMPESLITSFLKNFYICKKCKQRSCRLCKMGTVVFNVCLHCSLKENVSDQWTKDLRL